VSADAGVDAAPSHVEAGVRGEPRSAAEVDRGHTKDNGCGAVALESWRGSTSTTRTRAEKGSLSAAKDAYMVLCQVPGARHEEPVMPDPKPHDADPAAGARRDAPEQEADPSADR
jgi:hypothetical protein